ncbi:uncharacterized protein, partial [Epargyreus clarus]|uniref:uncharacterized protein n=1 Tax=Epargyreus clarus TaxID=520877 RepID=UPI003C303C6A
VDADNSDTELDFTEHWSFFNVQQEILRGIQLRQEKPVEEEVEYDLIDVDFSVPSCSKRKHYNEYNQNSSTIQNVTYRRKRKVTNKRRLKKPCKRKLEDQHCPLRIVELAEPLKRQCLNTWKNNCRVLPDYMVDRLRRHVEDKNPVVQISDAVHYFKKNKKTSKKCSSKRCKPISKYSSEENIRHILLLCAIFGYKISRKLKTPANIILSPELAKINHIVSDEINSIMRNKRSKNIYKNDKVLVEMSKKVTIWIASVLEETSYKQLLEQLDDLEEEEGPVLDFIDELLDNIPILSESSSSTEVAEENDIISRTSSKNNSEVTESIHDNISKSTIDKEKPEYVVPANTDQLLTDIFEDSISGHEINDINEKNDTENHLRSLLEDRINYIVGNDNIEDNINITPGDSIIDLLENPKDANIDLLLNLENNVNNPLLGTDKEYIGKEATFISLDHFAGKTTTLTASTSSKDELSSNMENDNNEVSLNLENNINSFRLSTDKEYVNKDDTVTSLDDVEADNDETITAAGSKTDLPSESAINDLTLTLGNDTVNVLPSTDIEYISKDEDNTPEIDKPKDSSENNDQSIFFIQGIDEQQNDLKLQSDTGGEINDLTEDEIEGGTKKVKFSDILRDHLRNSTGMNNRFELDSYDYKEPLVWKSSKEYISSHFNIAPPNPNLLSDADESWPAYILPPLLKATESVSKSVTSLGRIIESDEGSLLSPHDKSSMEHIKNLVNKEPDVSKTKSIDENVGRYNKIDEVMLQEDYLSEVFTKGWQRESKSMHDKMVTNNINDPNILQPTTEKVTHDCGDVKTIKRDIATQCDELHTKRSLTNGLLKAISEISAIDNSSTTVDKKIQTSAVIIFSRDELKQYDVQKWCIGLENVAANFELWAEWIQNVCISASRLKYKEYNSKSCQFTTKNINKWVNLKKSIDIDVQRWLELKRTLRRGLKDYKRTFVEPKVPFIQADKNCKCNKNSKKNMFVIPTNVLRSLLQNE